MGSGEISHTGIVRRVGERVTEVEIVSASACASCHAAGLCTAAEAKKKAVEVPTDRSEGFVPGETVDVILKKSMGMKAVLLAYAVPVLILIFLVTGLTQAGVHELAAAAAGIGGTVLWYLVVYLLRDRIAGEYVFCIKRK